MNKSDIIAFFDELAPGWDADMIRNEEVIAEILDNASVSRGKRVLDVACGTGVLIPDYRKRGAEVTGIDISGEMIRVAREKFSGDPGVTLLTGDAEALTCEKGFDVVMVYNAFPHFPEPERLIRKLAALCVPGGVLSVAHGMSREKLTAHHSGRARKVSLILPEADSLAELFAPDFDVTVRIDNDVMYQVVGIRK